MLFDGRWNAASVRYVHSGKELKEAVSTNPAFHRHPFLIQEYICGEGRGIFALCNGGRPIIYFAHRRLREKPPSGGVSVLSESIEVDLRLKELSHKILQRVGWHGVAMVEFKVTPCGKVYLMEVNARFWGSLQLAIDAGVDFPWLVYQLARGSAIDTMNCYTTGVKSRWLLGDLDNVYLSLIKQNGGKTLSYSDRMLILKRFLSLYDSKTRYEVNRWDDLKPFLFELKSYFKHR